MQARKQGDCVVVKDGSIKLWFRETTNGSVERCRPPVGRRGTWGLLYPDAVFWAMRRAAAEVFNESPKPEQTSKEKKAAAKSLLTRHIPEACGECGATIEDGSCTLCGAKLPENGGRAAA